MLHPSSLGESGLEPIKEPAHAWEDHNICCTETINNLAVGETSRIKWKSTKNQGIPQTLWETAWGNPDPETEAGTIFPVGENTSPNPNGTGCPIIVLPEDGSSPDGESKETCSQCDQGGDTRAEEESVPVGDVVDPRERDTAPATTPPSPVALAEAEEKIPIAEYHAPTPEGYVTPTGVLSATGFPNTAKS